MQADFILDYDTIAAHQPHTIFLVARLIIDDPQSHQQRQPLNISLVVDRSGSMEGQKLDYTRQAAQFLVQNLNEQDTLSIVLYNNKVETLLPPAPVLHKDAINQRIAAITASGTTNLSGGWLEAASHVQASYNTTSINRIILMTDGLANRGVTETPRLIAIGEQKLEEGISTTTMGLGDDFNEELLIKIAEASGGNFYFIESPEVTPTIFADELEGLLNVVGQNLQITLHYGEAIADVTQLNAYPVVNQPGEATYRIGDIFNGEVKTLVLGLNLHGFALPGQYQIATLRFTYDALNETGAPRQMIERPVYLNVTDDAQPLLPDPEAQQSVLLLKAAHARRSAVQEADQGHYTQASQILIKAAQDILNSGLSDPALSDEHKSLMQQADSLQQGERLYDAYNRKVLSSQAIYTMNDRHNATQAMRLRELERLHQQQTIDQDTKPKTTTSPTSVRWNNQIFPLSSELIRIGRAAQNEIVIDAQGVSRFHCQIRRVDNTLLLEDLGSTNGTLFEGQPLQAPHTLSAGDEIQLCNEILIFSAD